MIVTMCGSIRFEDLYMEWGRKLALAGHTPLGLSFYGADLPPNPVQKAILDGAHLRRIAAGNGILVLNQGGYVGQSTLSEIIFATDTGKRAIFLEPHLTTDASGKDLVHFEDHKTIFLTGKEEPLYTFDNGTQVDALLRTLAAGGSARARPMAN